MAELLEKISSYNIYNHLLPGVVFVVFTEALTCFHLIQEDLIIGVFLYYFIGLIISRLGSLFIEPFLKYLKFVQFSPYADYISAAIEDKDLSVLSETNNMYRTLCSLFISLFLLKIFELLSREYPVLRDWAAELMVIGLLALFCFSYRKQTKFITKRIRRLKRKEL